MSISIHSQTGKLSPMGTGRWVSSQTAGKPGRVPERDQAAISRINAVRSSLDSVSGFRTPFLVAMKRSFS